MVGGGDTPLGFSLLSGYCALDSVTSQDTPCPFCPKAALPRAHPLHLRLLDLPSSHSSVHPIPRCWLPSLSCGH